MKNERENPPLGFPQERELEPRQASLQDEFPQARTEPEQPEAVQYYDHMEGELKHTQLHKAKKFVEHGCVKYNGEGKFICEPAQATT